MHNYIHVHVHNYMHLTTLIHVHVYIHVYMVRIIIGIIESVWEFCYCYNSFPLLTEETVI